jgi:translin
MLSNVQADVEKIDKKFKDIEERRNAIIKGTRDATILCSKAIVSIHAHKKKESIENIAKAKKLLQQFKEMGKDDLQKYLYVAEQEFVEAYCLFSIESTSDINTLFELMDKIYGIIYPLAVYDNLMPGLRKKLDVSRILIENVRAILTEESRRTIMIEKMHEFEKKIMTSEKSKPE